MCREKTLAMCLLNVVSDAANMRSLPSEASARVQSWSPASAPCLTLTGTSGAIFCPHWGSHASTFLPPFPPCGFAFRTSHAFQRFGTMKALTPAPLTTHSTGLPAYRTTPSGRSVSNHVGPPDHRLPPRQRDQRVSDFALNEQARRSTPAESSSFTYGPTFRLQLLSTSPCDDAVTFGYGAVAYSDTDSHRASVAPSRAHSPPKVLIGGPVQKSPVVSKVEPPLKICGNDGLRIDHI